MTVAELIKQLNAYPEEIEVKIFDDWGNSYITRPITNVIDSTEFEETGTSFVVICFEIGTQTT